MKRALQFFQNYIEWTSDNKAVAKMLYDHKYDYDENINVVDDPEFKLSDVWV